VVVPRLHEAFADFATTTNRGGVGVDDPAKAYEIRFPLRVEAPHARAAAKIARESVQQAMRDAGVRGVVSVLDGWPVSAVVPRRVVHPGRPGRLSCQATSTGDPDEAPR
jgi:hypothetical protein